MAPKKLPVRPTTDFAKEALFNILHNKIDFDEASLLDLFSGTGNISFEFGSRGTKEITSVDAHYGCVKYINTISEELDFNIKTVKSDVFKYLNTTPFTFDVIFADPPYNLKQEEFESIVSKTFDRNLLNEDGFLIIEHSKHTDLSKVKQFVDARRYGGSVFSFFE